MTTLITHTLSRWEQLPEGLQTERSTERKRDTELEMIMLTEYPASLRREGVFVLSSKTPAGC